MHKTNVLIRTIAVAGISLAFSQTVGTQGGGLSAARVSHIGVVVPDIETALGHYSRVMGFAATKINSYPIPTPDGQNAQFKLATLYMPNFFIEVIQPVNAVGPYHEHLHGHGMSIQHVGLATPGEGSVDDVRAGMEQQGGRWTLGAKGNNFAYVNFQPVLGTTLEVIHGGGDPSATLVVPGAGAPAPLAALTVSHVGFAASDAAAVTSRFARVLGIMPPKVIEYKDSQYPPDAKWSRTAFLRLANWNQGGVGLEFIESVGGPTPWSEYVAHHKGTAAQHIAINVGARMDETIADLVAKGGKWTNGKPGGGYAYLDFMDTLGLIFELTGTSKSGGK